MVANPSTGEEWEGEDGAWRVRDRCDTSLRRGEGSMDVSLGVK